jgi:hypothetical protein
VCVSLSLCIYLSALVYLCVAGAAELSRKTFPRGSEKILTFLLATVCVLKKVPILFRPLDYCNYPIARRITHAAKDRRGAPRLMPRKLEMGVAKFYFHL